MRSNEYHDDPNVEDMQEMNRCCTVVTLLSKFVLLLACGVIFLAVRHLQ